MDKTPAPDQTPITFTSSYPQISYPTSPNGPIQFENGHYATDNTDEIAFLDARATCTRAT